MYPPGQGEIARHTILVRYRHPGETLLSRAYPRARDAGDMGFTTGCYQFQRRKPGAPPVREGSGTYLTVWRRQADGPWQAVFDTGIASPSR